AIESHRGGASRSAKPMAAPPPAMPMAPPYVPRASSVKEAAPDASAYLAKLAMLAGDLDRQAKAAVELGALRLLRQRLTEWVEDLRSVGGHEALADAVEREVKRLTAALAGGTDLATAALAVASELARLAGGGAPPRSGG